MTEKVSPSTEENKLVSSEELDNTLLWMKGKSALEIAVEISRLRNEAVLGRVDLLTGLKNRRGLEESLVHLMPLAVREKKEVVVTVLDLDELKQINDTKGHEEGDKLIFETSNRLHSVNLLRKSDIVARIGGDEFAVVTIVKDEEDAEIISRKLMNALSGLKISIGSSVWYTGEDFRDVLKRADDKMYINKKERRIGHE